MTAKELHKQAMGEADCAIDLGKKGDHEAAQVAYARASRLDEQAMESVK